MVTVKSRPEFSLADGVLSWWGGVCRSLHSAGLRGGEEERWVFKGVKSRGSGKKRREQRNRGRRLSSRHCEILRTLFRQHRRIMYNCSPIHADYYLLVKFS